MLSGATPCSRRGLLRPAVVGPLGALALSACGGAGQTALSGTGSTAPATQSDHLGGIIVDPILSYSSQQWGAAMTDVIAGKTQPQAALQQLQQQVTAEYQRSFPQG